MSQTVDANDPARSYDHAVAAAEMRNIRLIRSDFLVEPQGIGGDRTAWKMGYACKLTEARFDPDRSRATGLVVAEAWCKLGSRKIVSVKASYMVAYDIQGDVEPDAAEQFVKRVGTFAVYPYFRAHFAELTSQAGVSLGPLPVMKEGRRLVSAAPEAKPSNQS